MRKKVRRALALLLAIALSVSVMSGMAFSAEAGREADNEPLAAAAEVTQEAESSANGTQEKSQQTEDQAEPSQQTDDMGEKTAAAAPAQEEKKDVEQPDQEEAQKDKTASENNGASEQMETVGSGSKAITVKISAAAGTLPAGAKLVIKRLTGSDRQYQNAANQLEGNHVAYDDFLALDIGFEVNGKEVEPDGVVKVQFEVGTGLLPHGVDTNSLAVQHLNNNGKVETMTKDVAVTKDVMRGSFAVRSFSTFTITYSSASTAVNHIDIGSSLTATVVINGEEYQKNFTIDKSDAQYVTIYGAYKDGTVVSFTRSGVGTSSDVNGKAQIRIEGTFPVGTKDNPVFYTVTLEKTIVVNVDEVSYQVPVTLTVKTQYWDKNNVCPGLTGHKTQWQNGSVISGSGIDLELANGSGSTTTQGTLTVQKTVSGVTLTTDQTYTFQIYSVSSSQTETRYDTVQVKVKSGEAMGSTMLTQVPFGTYKIYETDGQNLATYQCETSYTTGQTEKISQTSAQGIFAVENAYSKSTNKLTIEKCVSGIAASAVSDCDYTFRVTGPENLNGIYSDVTFLSGVATVTLTGTGSKVIEGLPLGSYVVTESKPTATPSGYTFDTTTDTEKAATLTAAAAGKVTITNQYHKNPTVTILKSVTGTMGDKAEQFSFTAGTTSFTLRDQNAYADSKQVMEVAYGSALTIVETDYSGDGYRTSYQVGSGVVQSGRSCTLKNITEDTTIVFTNTKDIQAPTGWISNVGPYAAMVASASAGYLILRRKKTSEDW